MSFYARFDKYDYIFRVYRYHDEYYLSAPIHADRNHQCHECGRRFEKRSQLIRHMENVHRIKSTNVPTNKPYHLKKQNEFLHDRFHVGLPGGALKKNCDQTSKPAFPIETSVNLFLDDPSIPNECNCAVRKNVNNSDRQRMVHWPLEFSEYNCCEQHCILSPSLQLQRKCKLHTPKKVLNNFLSTSFYKNSFAPVSASYTKNTLKVDKDTYSKPGQPCCFSSSNLPHLPCTIPPFSTETNSLVPEFPEIQLPKPFFSFEQLSANPYFYFIGAPSHYLKGHTAQLLKAARVSPRQHLTNFQRRIVPDGYSTISKNESITFPDGTVYTLTDCWSKDPNTKITVNAYTQTCDLDQVVS